MIEPCTQNDDDLALVLQAIREAHTRPKPLTQGQEEDFLRRRREGFVLRGRGVACYGPGRYRWMDVKTGPFRSVYPPLEESQSRIEAFLKQLRPDGRLVVTPGRKVVNRRVKAVECEAAIVAMAARMVGPRRSRAGRIANVLKVSPKHVRSVLARRKANL